MLNEILEQQKARYDLERKLHALQLREDELAQEVESAGNIFMVLYEAMAEHEKSLAYKMKKLFKKPDPEFVERYNDAVEAERQLKQAEDELEACRKDKAQIAVQLTKLPSHDLLRIRARKDPETYKVFSKAEAHYWAEKLDPLLNANWQALRELADFLRENEQAPKFPQSEFNRLFGASIAAAETCQRHLDKFRNALGQNHADLFFNIRQYYMDPKEFIWDARNGKSYSDRVITAMKQVREQQDRVKSSLEWLDRS